MHRCAHRSPYLSFAEAASRAQSRWPNHVIQHELHLHCDQTAGNERVCLYDLIFTVSIPVPWCSGSTSDSSALSRRSVQSAPRFMYTDIQKVRRSTRLGITEELPFILAFYSFHLTMLHCLQICLRLPTKYQPFLMTALMLCLPVARCGCICIAVVAVTKNDARLRYPFCQSQCTQPPPPSASRSCLLSDP